MFGNAGNPDQFWAQSSFSFKFYAIISVSVFLLSMFIQSIAVIFMDIPALTIYNFQIWRLFFSFLAQMPNVMSLLNLIFSFLWLRPMIKIIIINLQIHLVFNLMVFIMSFFISEQALITIYGFGWFPIILVYEFRNSAINPQSERNLCCLPFMIKSKYFPWVLLFLLGFLSNQFLCFVACGIVGYVQQIILKKMLIKLPYKFYTTLEKCLPDSIKTRSDYISINQVQSSLKTKCYGYQGSNWNSRNIQQNQQNSNNPFNQAQANHQVYNSGTGYTIGGNQNVDFRNFWAHKDENSGEQTQSFELQEKDQEQTNDLMNGSPSSLNLTQQDSQSNLRTGNQKNTKNNQQFI